MITWWRHQMETFSALLAICAGNSSALVHFPHKGQWRGALMISLISAWINGLVINRVAGDLRRHRAHYDITVMVYCLMVDNSAIRELEIELKFWIKHCTPSQQWDCPYRIWSHGSTKCFFFRGIMRFFPIKFIWILSACSTTYMVREVWPL